MKWVSAGTVLAIHDRQISEHGGGVGLRDMHLLESALSRPQQRYHDEGAQRHALAAEYAFGIARNLPFVEGNKRTAYVTARLFLKLNDMDFNSEATERVIMFVLLAQGELSVENFAEWIKKGSMENHNSP